MLCDVVALAASKSGSPSMYLYKMYLVPSPGHRTSLFDNTNHSQHDSQIKTSFGPTQKRKEAHLSSTQDLKASERRDPSRDIRPCIRATPHVRPNLLCTNLQISLHPLCLVFQGKRPRPCETSHPERRASTNTPQRRARSTASNPASTATRKQRWKCCVECMNLHPRSAFKSSRQSKKESHDCYKCGPLHSRDCMPFAGLVDICPCLRMTFNE